MRERYGPGAMLYLFTLSFPAFGLLLILLTEDMPSTYVVLIVALAFLLHAPILKAWVWFEIDDEGIRRRSLFGRDFYPWEMLGLIQGRRAEIQTRGGPAEVLIQVVVDEQGLPLFRLPPWLAQRRKLSRRIREEVSRRRKIKGVDRA